MNVVYRGADGPAEVLLFRDAEPRLEMVQATRAFSFDADGEPASDCFERERESYTTAGILSRKPAFLEKNECERYTFPAAIS